MKKRNFFILLVSIACFFSINGVFARTYNVKDFGAKGDGKSDDYSAILSVVRMINRDGGGNMYFPEGVYFINRYNSENTKFESFVFKNCNGLRIYGNKATISVKGNFHRKETRRVKNVFSDITPIVPIRVENCYNVTIENLTINGNADKMTKDKGVREAAAHLVYISGSRKVTLKNLKLHHAAADGLLFRSSETPTQDVYCYNIISTNNARMGLTIGALKNAVFENCSFLNSGYTGGKYGGHSPQAGLDIEPNSSKNTVSNIIFNNCTFENNRGIQIAASHVATTKDVFFNNCTIKSNEDNGSYAVFVNAKNIVFDACSFTLKGRGHIRPVWNRDGASSVFKNCLIQAEYRGIVAQGRKDSHVVITNCTLEYIGKKPMETYFPYIQMKEMEFTNNKIIIPEEYYRKEPYFTSLIQGVKLVKGNKFYSHGKLKSPKVSYAKSNVIPSD